MDCYEIIGEYLKQNGYDGLYNEIECGCLLEDLMPCHEHFGNCMPGYKHQHSADKYDYTVGPKEEQEKE